MLIDATQGRKVRSISTDSDPVIPSAVLVEARTQRFCGGEGA